MGYNVIMYERTLESYASIRVLADLFIFLKYPPLGPPLGPPSYGDKVWYYAKHVSECNDFNYVAWKQCLMSFVADACILLIIIKFLCFALRGVGEG